ncbi:unnamed protein product [Menidia menidia]|uniref:(Atlantic silverside) hypothetical protein n=1 Tax=Menidia menidia TaxID=238744 RepID=A0A8S4AL12_9TELE|nr:unnamed protein product [Menidia menidia]
MADMATRRTEGPQLSCWKTAPTTTPYTPPFSITPCEDCQKTEIYITHLKADIRRLSDELRKKESLLTDFIDTAAMQSKIISTMDSAMADTTLWDPPSLCHRPSSCSTPSSQAPWSVVVGNGKGKSGSPCATSPPSLQFTNRFATLPPDVPAHPADVPMADAVSVVGAPTTSPQTAPPVAAVTMALPSAAAVWSRTGARPKVSGPNSPANRPTHLPYGTDVVRGEHPTSPMAASDPTAPSVLIRQRGRSSSSSFPRRLLVVVSPVPSHQGWTTALFQEPQRPQLRSHPPLLLLLLLFLSLISLP